ncbi:ABC transporter permease [Vallicoccus soli]|uniref:ABC transporter permease n=1 Tax=Vallicoccus soli TaxID=2339232 RepID=UPI0015B3598F|nr:hypothetical protein [Vallicoccus soli]
MNALAGTGALARLALRRDRVRLPVWVVAVVGLVHATAAALPSLYGTPEEVAAYERTVGSSPASTALNGPPVALDTLGGIVVFESSTTALLATCLMGVFLVVRHTRGEEQEGRTELLRSAPVGRAAPLAAALLVVGTACLVVGAGIALSLLPLGLPARGSLLYGASVAAAGLVLTAVAACAAQVSAHSRGALGLAGAVLAAAFLLRAVGDVTGTAWSWASPLGWSQGVHAYGGDRWWPLLPSLAATVLLAAAAVALLGRRDLGGGLVADRPGPARGGALLGSGAGLALRLQRGSLLGWTAGVLLAGLAFGAFGREVESIVEGNPDLGEVLAAGGADVVDAFFATVVLLLALLSTGYAVGSVLRVRAEEAAGRAEALLATGLSRGRWLLGSLGVTVAGTVLVVAAGGLGAGTSHALATGDASAVPGLLGAALAHVPAVLVVAGVAALLVGWAPGAALAAWALLAGCFVVGWLGDLLSLPDAVAALSPFWHVPGLPAAPLRVLPLAVLTALAAALAAGALAGYRRRDVA